MQTQTFKDAPIGEQFSVENGGVYVKESETQAFDFNTLISYSFNKEDVISFQFQYSSNITACSIAPIFDISWN